MPPSISVILPVFNGEAYLVQAIESILTQSYKDFEFLIIDDGSTDSSPDIIKRYVALDERIRYIRQPQNMGLVSSLNLGLRNAKADLIARMDADDIAVVNRFELQKKYLMTHPNVAVLGGSINIINKEGKYIRKATFPQSLEAIGKIIGRSCPLAHPSVMMRKTIINEVGGYNDLFTNAEDYDLWLRIFDLGYELQNLSEILLQYRQHETKISTVNRNSQAMATLMAQMCHECRRAGLNDPLEGQTEITDTSVNLFPSSIREQFEIKMYEALYGNISLASTKEIKEAVVKVNELSKKEKDAPEITRIYLRCARGFWENGNYFSLIVLLGKIFRENPRGAFEFIRSKLG